MSLDVREDNEVQMDSFGLYVCWSGYLCIIPDLRLCISEEGIHDVDYGYLRRKTSLRAFMPFLAFSGSETLKNDCHLSIEQR